MKKTILFMMILVFGFGANLDAKCKFKNKIDAISKRMAESCNTTLDVCTRPVILFSKYRTSASIAMAKGGDKYYVLFYFMRTDSKKFELLKDNSLVLLLNTGEKIQIYPCGEFSGNYMGLSFNFMIKCLYKIDKQQLEKLSGNNVDLVSIHYTSEKEINGSQVDQEGKSMLDYEITNKTFQANPGSIAQCILSK